MNKEIIKHISKLGFFNDWMRFTFNNLNYRVDKSGNVHDDFIPNCECHNYGITMVSPICPIFIIQFGRPDYSQRRAKYELFRIEDDEYVFDKGDWEDDIKELNGYIDDINQYGDMRQIEDIPGREWGQVKEDLKNITI